MINGLQGVDRDLLLRAGHPTENREGVSATHLADHARAHEDDGNGLVIGNIERVETPRDGLGRLLPAVAAKRMTDDGVEGLALAVLADDIAELLRAGVGQFGPVAGRNCSRESGVVEALGVHREGDVLVGCLEHVTASGVHNHRFFLLQGTGLPRNPRGIGYWTIFPIAKEYSMSALISQEQQKSGISAVSHPLSLWIKKFSSPKIKIWFEPMFFYGFFCGFQRCGSAAFPNFRGGTPSPPAAAKCVRTNSRILHHVGKVKGFWFASRSLSALSADSATNLYSILGVKTNSRFRILVEENFLIQRVKTRETPEMVIFCLNHNGGLDEKSY